MQTFRTKRAGPYSRNDENAHISEILNADISPLGMVIKIPINSPAAEYSKIKNLILITVKKPL